MVVHSEASTQYGDMTGTASFDDADFERLGGVLGLPREWVLIGISLHASHPSLGIEGKDRADASYTSMSAWAVPHDDLVPGEGLPGLFSGDHQVEVHEFNFATADNVYPSETDALSILLRAAKRLNIVLWERALPHGAPERLVVVGEHSMVSGATGWVEEDPEY